MDSRYGRASAVEVSRSLLLIPIVLAIAATESPAQMADKSPAMRNYDPDAIAAPPGYTVEAFATDLDFPVDIAFGDRGEIYVAEAGFHSFGIQRRHAPSAQIVQLLPQGIKRIIYDHVVPMDEIRKHDSSATMPEGLIPPITGITWHEGKIYVAHRSRYSVLDPNTGDFQTIVNGLPCWGEFLNAKPIFDRDGKMVFHVATQGNAGVIEAHWMAVINAFDKKLAREIPGEDVTLTGKNFAVPVEAPTTASVQDKKMTGVYVPLGVKTMPGEIIPGETICNGAFFRCHPDGSGLERIAWGFRSCFGYRFSPDGRLICTQNSANPIPPRGLWYDFETLYEVVPGEWYGWPDFFSGIPITDPRFHVRKGPDAFVLTPETHVRLLKGRPLPRQPLVRLPPHSAPQGMVFGRAEFGLAPTDILVAEFGTIVPAFKPKGEEEDDDPPPDPVPADVTFDWPGFRVQRIDLDCGRAVDFLVNHSGMPSTAAKPDRPETGRGGGLERPVQLEWGPDGALYVVDFGVLTTKPTGNMAHSHTGAIWRVARIGAPNIRSTRTMVGR